jgi:hypothetical protein
MTVTLTKARKEKAHRLVDQMPKGATWEDLLHAIYVREAIKQGLSDSKAGRTVEVREVRAQYGLPQ